MSAASDVYVAISHPVRRRILDALSEGPAPVHALCGRFPVTQQAISKHLRVLTQSGLAGSERRGQENVYHLNVAPLNEVRAWLSEFWAAKLDSLKALAEGED
jgi:DNA-binding transcriptional ArsR family regulator